MKNEALTTYEIESVEKYFLSTSKGNVGIVSYYKDIVDDREQLKKIFHLNPTEKTILILTNVTWDTSCLGRDIAFSSMMDWVFKTIEFFKNKVGYKLLIRCHPAEGDVPHYMTSKETVSEIIANELGTLPSHIKVIGGKEPYNSHQLCELADLILVYTTTVGLEMACRGRQVIVCGESHYQGKGFSIDIDNIDQYYGYLNEFPSKFISAERKKLALKYAYFFLFRAQTYVSEFNLETRHEFDMPKPKVLLPEMSKLWDNLCDNIVEYGDFIDVSDKKEIENIIKSKGN